MKQTKGMAKAERLAGKPLEEAIPEMLNTLGWTETCLRLQASKGAIGYWMLKLGIEHRYVCVPQGYRLMLIPEDDLGIAQRIG